MGLSSFENIASQKSVDIFILKGFKSFKNRKYKSIESVTCLAPLNDSFFEIIKQIKSDNSAENDAKIFSNEKNEIGYHNLRNICAIKFPLHNFKEHIYEWVISKLDKNCFTKDWNLRRFENVVMVNCKFCTINEDIFKKNSSLETYLVINFLTESRNSLRRTVREQSEDSLCAAFNDLVIGYINSSMLMSEIFIKSNVTRCIPDGCGELMRGLRGSLMFAILGWSGQQAERSIEVYDTLNEKWFYLKQKCFIKRAYHGAVAMGHFIYVIGGYDGRNIYCSTYCFNIKERSWSRKPSMHEDRCYVTALAYKGLIYAFGGFDGDDRLRTCERYNPRTRRWEYISNMNYRRSDASGAVCKGKIFVCGGFNGLNILSSVEMYDWQSDQWTLIRPLLEPRSGHSMVSFKDSLIVIGGFNGSERLQSVERYDEEENRWIPFVPMITPRSNFAAVVCKGRIYVIAGYCGETTFSGVERFNDKHQKWESIKNLNRHRSALGACVFNTLEDFSTCQEPDEIIINRRNVEQSSP